MGVLQQSLAAFNAAAVGAAGFSDNFNDNSMDAAKWVVGTPGAPYTQDLLVTVAETSGQLRITPRSSFSGTSYSGYTSVSSYDFTNKNAQIEIINILNPGNTQFNFLIYQDANNYAAFNKYAFTMEFGFMNGGSLSNTSASFDDIAMRFIKFNNTGGNLVFETAPTPGTSWTSRRSVTAPAWLSSAKIAILAGTYSTGSSSPGTHQWDNFSSTLT